MKLSNQEITKTKAKYTIVADQDELNGFRDVVASALADTIKVPGFRPGKAPTDMILKNADQDTLQNEFLNLAVNNLYSASQQDIVQRIVGEPKINVTKFVPYTTLEIAIEVPIISEVKLPDYKNLKLTKTKPKVDKKLLDRNLGELQKRGAVLSVVKRAAKTGDLVVVDFKATDFKTKKELPPASATDYRLRLGEGMLIPGFEDQLIGLSAGKTKDFDLTFPADYDDKSFAGRKVHFKATVKEVNDVDLPKLDDAFAATIGPFKSLDELKTQIKTETEAEAERQSTIDYENRILNKIAEETKVEVDESLIDSEADFLLNQAKQSATSRGQTWQEFLESLGQTEDKYNAELRKVALTRIRGGLAIGEIATREGITVSENDLDNEITNLRARYNRPEMQQQLDDPNSRSELRMRLTTEKVLDFIQSNQSKTPKN